jgi:hypothetical protein
MFIVTLVYQKDLGGTCILILHLYFASDIIVICSTVLAVLKYVLYYITPTIILRLA